VLSQNQIITLFYVHFFIRAYILVFKHINLLYKTFQLILSLAATKKPLFSRALN